mmetsp:Transcript_24030/g.56716  ORF Transcript_24030/g.56716 Transcript_24030/m.56716 type:complete len:412 (+) Transcript_24030:60-1295(+)
MGPIEFRLVPTPGAKPEFLAKVEPIRKEDSPSQLWQSMISRNKVLVLEGYTRDSWALDTAATKWSSIQVKSVDGRNKLPGFVKYLRERQKACFGRFVASTSNANNKNNLNTFVLVISYKQTSSTQLSCRVAPIDSIPKCRLRPKSSETAPAAIGKVQAQSSTGKQKKKGFGLLGNLVGAQRRTNHQVVTANTTTSQRSTAATGENQRTYQPEQTSEDTGSANESIELVSSGKILADFRHAMEQKMLDFDIAPDMSMKVPVKLSEHTKRVQESDKDKITMEVLKYIVYEQAEEVNEEWIAHKEPSEFTDEIIVAIYKDADSAPADVIEEMNQAEIPEEVKAEQNMAEKKRRQQEANALRIQEALHRQALRKMAAGDKGEVGAGGISVLNTEKRDLRTIEEIQHDSAKRRKVE